MNKFIIKLANLIIRSKCFKRYMKYKGLEGYSSKLVVNALKEDILNKNIPISTKIWAWRKGFSGTRVQSFNINQSNYKSHMPDFDYYKLHPINGSYGHWIDDKLTMKYIFSPFNEFMPKYYFQIENEKVLKLMDCPYGANVDIESIINILKENKTLALKLLAGSTGDGFYKLACKNKKFYINSKEATLDELKNLLENSQGYLVTEYINSHEDIRKIYDVTPNTLRVQVIKDKNKKPRITGCFIRFGTKKSGVLETSSAGSIFAGIDIESGVIFNPNTLQKNKPVSMSVHPDTSENIEIELPRWEEVKQKVYEISNYVPSLEYLGFDIVITDNGFKILEINSLTSTTVLSYYFPFFENRYCKEFFLSKFKKDPKKFKRLLDILDI